MLKKQIKRLARKKRIKAKVQGSLSKPRLCVFKSNQHIYAQIIDDESGKTLFSANDFSFAKDKSKKSEKLNIAFEVGKSIAKAAVEKNIKKVVFDRSGYRYHGNIKLIADGAREGGLEF